MKTLTNTVLIALCAGAAMVAFLLFSGVLQLRQDADAAHNTPAVAATSNVHSERVAKLALMATQQAQELERVVQQLRIQNEQQERQINQIRQQLEELNSSASAQEDSIGAAGSNRRLPVNQPGGRVGGRGAFGEPDGEEQQAMLQAAGVDPATAAAIRERRDRYQLERLELVDTARREDWLDTDRFEQQVAILESGRVNLKNELSPSTYDKYLFEAGRSNRIAVSTVIGGSAAQTAGVQVGDIIWAYAGERIYRMSELQSATSAGVRGEAVELTVARNEELLSLSIPRGPLGVTLQPTRQPPF